MKLITETTEDVQTLIEGTDSSKNYYITGPFMNANVKNRNGRFYPRHVLENQVSKYATLINEKRAIGELSHPNGPQINMDRVSHLITELKWDGNDVIGKAKVLDTPCGKIVKNFLDEGIKIGVSTRGMGSVRLNKDGINEVQDDFHLVCVDIVNDPSGPSCFVQGLMEGKEWVHDPTLGWMEIPLSEMKKEINQKVRSKELTTEQKFKLFEKYVNLVVGRKVQ